MRKKQTCFVIGHRELDEDQLPLIHNALLKKILELHFDGAMCFKLCVLPGFSLLAAQAVLKCKEMCPSIRLCLVLPCQEYAGEWCPGRFEGWSDIISRADKLIFAQRSFHPYSTKNNMATCIGRVATRCHFFLCYLEESHGVTYAAFKKAYYKRRHIINLSPTMQNPFCFPNSRI